MGEQTSREGDKARKYNCDQNTKAVEEFAL